MNAYIRIRTEYLLSVSIFLRRKSGLLRLDLYRRTHVISRAILGRSDSSSELDKAPSNY